MRSPTLLSWLVWAMVPACSPAVNPPSEPPNVVLITVDTLRADHLKSYGYARNTTPGIDALADRGVSFRNTIVPSAETLPSLASILTSVYPIDHGIRGNGQRLQGPQRTLAEILRERAYTTAAFVSSIVVRSRSGLNRGFDVYDEELSDPFLLMKAGQRTAEKTTRAVLEWLDHPARKRRKFFLWVHYIDPHSLYAPPGPYAEMFRNESYAGPVTGEARQFLSIIKNEFRLDANDTQYLVDLYDGEIAFVDSQVGALVSRLDELGLTNTVVVFTADHGESLGEHDYYFDHGDLLYDHQLRVPLILRHPGLPPGRVVEEQVESVDILPTILEFLGIQAPRALRGRSLLPLIEGTRGSHSARAAFSESDSCRKNSVRRCTTLGIDGKSYSLRTGRWKYIFNPDASDELFELARDPGEEVNRIEEQPVVAERMRRSLDALLAPSVAEEQSLSEETRKQLRALGYAD